MLGAPVLRPLWTTVGGLRMFARVSAVPRGDDIVLLHGLAVSSRYMVPLALELAKHHTVWAPDLPGFGKSQRTPRALGPQEQAEWLKAWLDSAGLKQALFVGNSMGCQALVELALRYPDTVGRLVLLGPTFDKTAPHRLSQVWRLFLDQFREPLSLVPMQAFEYLHFGTSRTLKTFTMGVRHPMLQRARLVRQSTLILRGNRDPIVSREWTQMLGSAMPNARTEEIARAAHALNYNSPRQVIEQIDAWSHALDHR